MQFLRAFSFIVLVAFLAACDQTPPSKGEPGPQGLPGERGSTGTSWPRRSFSCSCRSDVSRAYDPSQLRCRLLRRGVQRG